MKKINNSKFTIIIFISYFLPLHKIFLRAFKFTKNQFSNNHKSDFRN